jgi:hypothetical protein
VFIDADATLKAKATHRNLLCYWLFWLTARKRQSTLAGGARAKKPPVTLIDTDVVNAGLTPAHEPAAGEFPQFVAVTAPALPARVVAFVLEPHGDAVLAIPPEFLAQCRDRET